MNQRLKQNLKLLKKIKGKRVCVVGGGTWGEGNQLEFEQK